MTSTTRRLGDLGVGQGINGNEQSQSLKMPAIGSSYATNWNNANNIWSSAIGSGMKANDSARPQAKSAQLTNGDSSASNLLASLDNSEEITGSGSLLSTSESDTFFRRNSATQWPALSNNLTAGLSNARNGHGSTSPVRSRTNQHTRSNSPFTSTQLTAIGSAPGKTVLQSQSFLDPTTPGFNSSFGNSLQMPGSQARQSSEDANSRNLSAIHFGSLANGTSGFPNSGYASSAASRSGSLPPSRHGHDPPSAQFGDMSANSFHPSKSEIFTHRQNQSSRNSNYSHQASNKPADQNWMPASEFAANFERMNLGKDNGEMYSSNNWDQSYHVSSPSSTNGSYSNNMTNYSRNGSLSYEDPRMLQASQAQYTQSRIAYDRNSQTPSESDARQSYDSPLYTNSTSPMQDHQRASSNTSSRAGYGTGLNGQIHSPAALERSLRRLQEQQGIVSAQANTMMRYGQSNGYYNQNPYAMNNLTPQALARMNVGNQWHPAMMPPYQGSYVAHSSRQPPRGPAAIEESNAASLRSALMEEFRSSKGNKRYDLKDIYNHIVEFSGDQHGSRFIQQKLETANSDEKAQLFSEIYPNAWQLITDVFGNYVIQKFFDHGNQTQKKQIADKMKGHIPELSIQMYGCRVVQKAFEHILADQQAILVRELEPDIIKIIKDQNGNHVVQKAIQRVPPEHVTFINDAVRGHVTHLASHSYGCRVIQRMLEYCPTAVRVEVIEEIQKDAALLTADQYGNYVIQNVIDHGRPEDKERLVRMTIDRCIEYSRHKFASNVVEHCLRSGSKEQQQEIVTIVTALNDKGETEMHNLVRDQFGNYVIQTILKVLNGAELDNFIAQVKPVLQAVRQFSYGKHIGQIEKLIQERQDPNSPPLVHHRRQPHLERPHNDSSYRHANGSRYPVERTQAEKPRVDISAAATPPALVEDNQSPRSSSLPSTNISAKDEPVGLESPGGGQRAKEIETGIAIVGSEDISATTVSAAK